MITMINDLNIPDTDIWKYVDDSTISETVSKSESSEIQQAVDEFATQASADKFQLNEAKGKELRITFSHSRKNFDPRKLNDQDLKCDNHAQILGLQIASDLTWNNHISEIVKKVNKRPYFLCQLLAFTCQAGRTFTLLLDLYKTCYWIHMPYLSPYLSL